MYDAIDNCVQNRNEDVRKQAEAWINTNVARLQKRLELKLSVHKPRYTTIKKDCYDLRKSKIWLLHNRIQRHLQGIDQVLEDMQSYTKIKESDYITLMENYQKAVDAAYENVRTCKNDTSLVIYESDYKLASENMEEGLDGINRDVREKLLESLIVLKRSQLEFLHSISLKQEPGNVNSEEAKTHLKSTKRWQKMIDKQYKKVAGEQEKLHVKYAKEFQKDDRYVLENFQKCKEEFEFNAEALRMLKAVQKFIRKEVYEAKYKLKRTENIIEIILRVQTERLGDMSFIGDNLELAKRAKGEFVLEAGFLEVPSSLFESNFHFIFPLIFLFLFSRAEKPLKEFNELK